MNTVGPQKDVNFDYQRRRQQLAQQIDGSCLVLHGAKLSTRSHDTEYPFRQNSHFDYLTGHPEPETILVITTRPEVKSLLFVPPKDPKMELWTGKRLGTEQSKHLSQVDECYEMTEFAEKMPELAKGHRSLYVDMAHEEHVMQMYKLTRRLSNRRKAKDYFPQGLMDITPLIGQMRLKKESGEIELMRKAADISCTAHKAAMVYSCEGRYEYQTQALMEYIFKASGATDPAYTSIVAGGNNANVLHYIENKDQLKAGEYLLIDAGCEYQAYASDITRTFPISGTYEGAGREVYEIVLRAQKKVIQNASPGQTLKGLHEIAAKELIQGLIELNVLKGDVEENFKKENHKAYFPHGTSHWIGIDVHDNTPYLTEDLEDIKFEPGMAFTVEPGLYFPAEDESLPQKLHGIGIRIEDDILITQNGHENLTYEAPKEIKDVEDWCAKTLEDIEDLQKLLKG